MSTALSNSQVQQTPRDLLKQPGDDVQLNCSHKIPSYNTILWYKQLKGDPALKLIGYVYYKNPTLEMSGQNFNLTGNGENDAFLHVDKLKPVDSAVYFCAASYAQCCFSPLPSTKTHTVQRLKHYQRSVIISHCTTNSEEQE